MAKDGKAAEKAQKEFLKDLENGIDDGSANVFFDDPMTHARYTGVDGQADYFVFDPTADPVHQSDVISNFEPGLDKIVFVNFPEQGYTIDFWDSSLETDHTVIDTSRITEDGSEIIAKLAVDATITGIGVDFVTFPDDPFAVL
jgi:hypothetical protein